MADFPVTLLEIDLPRCIRRHNLGGCLAALEGEFLSNAAYSYVFEGGATHGFAGASSNGTLTGGVGYATWTETTSDPMLRSPAALAINGAVDFIIRIEIERISDRSSGSWDGHVFYSTSGGGSHGESGSFTKTFSEITIAQGRQVIELDMSALSAGGTDWVTHTVTQIRLDFDNGTNGAFRIYAVQVGHYASADEATGTIKCFNTRGTCQDLEHFNPLDVTARFTKATETSDPEVDALPYLVDVDYSPAIIPLGEPSLGQRPSVQANFINAPSPDTGPLGDPYRLERPYVPWEQGTWAGKMLARYKSLRGFPMRLITGLTNQVNGEDRFDVRHFIVDDHEPPALDGRWSVTGKDPLKLADGDRAKAPKFTPGKLLSAVLATDFSATLAPVGIGDEHYASSGYMNIGGDEVVAFARDLSVGNDANTKLLLHADGADAATTITDSSASARTVTVNGNLQLDTGWKKFGSASMLFDGTGDYATVPDHADWAFGTANFAVDTWLRITSLAVQRTIFCQQTDANNRQQLFVTTAGAIGFTVTSASATIITLTSANGVIAINTDYHVALVRNGTGFAIYVNGVSVATVTDSDSIPNYTGAFTIGMQGTSANPMLGWLDEFRVSSVARWTAAFNVPIAPYANSTDVLYFSERGAYRTEAQDHDAGARCQQCLEIDSQRPSVGLQTLFVGFTPIPSSVITIEDWLAEDTAYYRRLINALIVEPTPVSDLAGEIMEECGLALWWDELNGQIRFQVLRNISTDAERFDDTNVVEGSLRIDPMLERRLSRVQVYYGLKNPLLDLDDPNSYLSSVEKRDDDAELLYGGEASKTILSRWIAGGGETTADRCAAIQLGRYVNPPRHFSFNVYRWGNSSPELGEGGRLIAHMEDPTGAAENVPIQNTRVMPGEAEFEVEADEMLFEEKYDTGGDEVPTVIFSADQNNINLRDEFDDVFPAPADGDVVDFYVNLGVIIGSTSTSVEAMNVGTWPTLSKTGNRTSGNPTLTGIADTTGLAIGQRVFGTGIPAGAKILSIVPNTSITLDANASSGAGTSTALTIHTVIINLYLRGRVQGKGGNGGQGGTAFNTTAGDGSPGQAGGLAFYSRYGINLFLDTGDAEIFGGGGGGGGASAWFYSLGDGGGGGAGSVPGSGGAIGGSAIGEQPGAPGTTEAGGLGGHNTNYGGSDPHGGNGGGPGLAGASGTTFGSGYDGGAGGGAGGAIDGVSYLVKTGTGDIRGTQVN